MAKLNSSLGQLAYLLEKGGPRGGRLSGNLDQRGQALIAGNRNDDGAISPGRWSAAGMSSAERLDARGDAMVGQLGSKVDQLESLIDVRGGRPRPGTRRTQPAPCA